MYFVFVDIVAQCDVINLKPSFSFSQFRSCPPKEIRVDHEIMRLGHHIYWTGLRYFFWTSFWSPSHKSLSNSIETPASKAIHYVSNIGWIADVEWDRTGRIKTKMRHYETEWDTEWVRASENSTCWTETRHLKTDQNRMSDEIIIELEWSQHNWR